MHVFQVLTVLSIKIGTCSETPFARIQKHLFRAVVVDRMLILTLFVCEREREKE
jgi:hypothetical protein